MNSVKSAGGFLGLSNGPQAPGVQSDNAPLENLNGQLQYYANGYGDKNFKNLENYANGTGSESDLFSGPQADEQANFEGANQLATNPLTGSKFATEQVQNNPILGQLFGKDGELGKQTGILDKLQNQGFQLTPEDQTLYGQTSGNIARMFGSQGNQASQDLANRGLASAPSGAAGAMFSGINGNQNEMLAKAQQSIMQQRFENTQKQIAQQQSFVNSLGQQGANDINQQYGRQSQGAQDQRDSYTKAGSLNMGQNQGANQANMAAANFNVQNTPANFMDFASAGAGQGLESGLGGSSGSSGTYNGKSYSSQGSGLAGMFGPAAAAAG